MRGSKNYLRRKESRRRTNAEIYELFDESLITDVARSQRITWLGHVSRFQESRIRRKAMERMLLDTRRGRPENRWLDVVEADLRLLGVSRWKEKAQSY